MAGGRNNDSRLCVHSVCVHALKGYVCLFCFFELMRSEAANRDRVASFAFRAPRQNLRYDNI